MGILDGIVAWIAEKVMACLDLVTTSVLGALGCNMDVFIQYFPAAETLYDVFVAIAIGLVLLNMVWQLFKNFAGGLGLEVEDPGKLVLRSALFILLIYFSDEIVDMVLKIGGTPYSWILASDLPPINFASFNAVVTVILGVIANGVMLIVSLMVTTLSLKPAGIPMQPPKLWNAFISRRFENGVSKTSRFFPPSAHAEPALSRH